MGYNPNFSDRVGQLSHFNHICHIRYIDIYIRYTDCAVLLKTFQKGVEGGGGLVKPMLKKVANSEGPFGIQLISINIRLTLKDSLSVQLSRF